MIQAPPNVFADAEIFGPERLKYFTVLEADLERLQSASGDEALNSAFFFGCAGAFAGGLFGYIPAAETLGAKIAAIYVALLVVCGLATIYFSVKWWRSFSTRRRVLVAVTKSEGRQRRTAQLTDPNA